MKLIDFNAALRFEPGKPMMGKTGEPRFSAPELALSYDEKVDLWSCGLILYFLLSGGDLMFEHNKQFEENLDLEQIIK